VAEISRDYPTAYRDVAERLRRLAADEEVVLAEEEYHTYPLMFYEGHRLRFGCLLNRASPLCEGVVRRLAAPLYLEEHFPHWVVVFGRSRRAAELIELFSRPHQEKGREVRYQYRRLKESVDRYWFDTSRPELHWHTFGPKTDFDRSHEAVYLFRRSLAEAP
jgi:hypothetical protein